MALSQKRLLRRNDICERKCCCNLQFDLAAFDMFDRHKTVTSPNHLFFYSVALSDNFVVQQWDCVRRSELSDILVLDFSHVYRAMMVDAAQYLR
jgi:hypothetical protein